MIRINKDGVILESLGLPLAGGTNPLGSNSGYGTSSAQQSLYAPYDAKVIGDYTGLTPPFDLDDNVQPEPTAAFQVPSAVR